MGKRPGRLCLLGFLFCMLLALFGCGGGSGPKSSVEPLPDVVEIPEDGIITKEQFETFAGEDRQVTFEGVSDGISYSWTFDGRQIMNPQDQNLKLTVMTEDIDEIKTSANHATYALGLTIEGKELICAPALTIRLSEKWEADMAILVKEQKGKLARLADVTLDQSDTTSLSWIMTSIPGTCYIVAGKSSSASESAKGQLGTDRHDEGQGKSSSTDHTYGSDHESGALTGDGSQTAGDEGAMTLDAGMDEGGNTSSSFSDKNTSSTGKATVGQTSGSKNSGDKTAGNKTSSGKDSGNKASKALSCKISISCATILNNMDKLAGGKEEFVPSNGWILKETSVEFKDGDTVFDILQSVCRSKGIHMESANTIVYGSAYIEGINQLYEFDCGELSGWMFSVNGWYPNYGCSKYTVSDGDVIRWIYTCDLGQDLE